MDSTALYHAWRDLDRFVVCIFQELHYPDENLVWIEGSSTSSSLIPLLFIYLIVNFFPAFYLYAVLAKTNSFITVGF
uniref:Uncharacterized protein n=1 Tax=Nelumbo nucifera TaxID=4432 RepID=A0A822YL06_NELNU|nr:TPA_asm: hypothetical protein HUJ06_010820 [Nelumbo nucifera]